MSELFLKGINFFLEKTLPFEYVHADADTAKVAFLILGILLLLFGSRIYTLFTSFIVFGGVSIAICTLMYGNADRRATVTTFVLVGCLLAFSAYKWKKFDAVIVTAMASAGVAYIFGAPMGVIILSAINFGLLAGFRPRAGAIVSTTVIGGFLVWEYGIKFVAVFIICGLLFQLIWYGLLTERRAYIWKQFFARN